MTQRPYKCQTACRKYAVERGWNVDDGRIFFDEAISGSRTDRAGLNEMMELARTKNFEALLVDDLSRLARNILLMLSMIHELRFLGIRVVSVADGLDSNQEEANLSIQLRGIANELFLTDLRKKTMRGQIGQKGRGFFVGERAFGYRSLPVGTGRKDKKGQPRPDGYKMETFASEAAVVREIFEDFASGKSVFSMVNDLNRREVQGRYQAGKWSAPTIMRMVRNEKYIGRWIWNRMEHRRDTQTNKVRVFPKDPTKWCVVEDEALRIIPHELWQRVQNRLEELGKVWHRGQNKRGFECQRGSRVSVYPRRLLSGSMICGRCGGAIGEVTGRKGGYYGCLKARRTMCDNRLLVRRKKIERLLLEELRNRILNVDSIEHVLQKIKVELDHSNSDLPSKVDLKVKELNDQQRRITYLVEVVADGRGTRSITDALSASEKRTDDLKAELEILRRSLTDSFCVPPRAWVEERLHNLQQTLDRNVGASALLLRKVLGPIRLDVVIPDIGRPYYVARSKLCVVELLNVRALKTPIEPPCAQVEEDSGQGGSNTFQWWRRGELNPRPKAFRRRPLHA